MGEVNSRAKVLRQEREGAFSAWEAGRLARRSQGSESERDEAEWGRGEARAAAEPEARAGPAEEPGRPVSVGHFHPRQPS